MCPCFYNNDNATRCIQINLASSTRSPAQCSMLGGGDCANGYGYFDGALETNQHASLSVIHDVHRRRDDVYLVRLVMSAERLLVSDIVSEAGSTRDLVNDKRCVQTPICPAHEGARRCEIPQLRMLPGPGKIDLTGAHNALAQASTESSWLKFVCRPCKRGATSSMERQTKSSPPTGRGPAETHEGAPNRSPMIWCAFMSLS
jgi:hypothetical protein